MRNYNKINRILLKKVRLTDMILEQENRIFCFQNLLDSREKEVFRGQLSIDRKKLEDMKRVKRRLERSFDSILNKYLEELK